jgi:hypothetical protein
VLTLALVLVHHSGSFRYENPGLRGSDHELVRASPRGKRWALHDAVGGLDPRSKFYGLTPKATGEPKESGGIKSDSLIVDDEMIAQFVGQSPGLDAFRQASESALKDPWLRTFFGMQSTMDFCPNSPVILCMTLMEDFLFQNRGRRYSTRHEFFDLHMHAVGHWHASELIF